MMWRTSSKIMGTPFLNWLENCAVRFLLSSPRVGFIAIKHYGHDHLYVVQDATDPQVATVMEKFAEPVEPLSMQLERLYHEPAYGENE
jgi:hypothetical protein